MQNYWTPERDEELRRHAAAGLSASKIAVLLHTTQAAIRGRSKKLRVSLGMMRSFWTPERDEELRRHADEAAAPSPAMKSRRCIDDLPRLNYSHPIAV